ncbi:hypothetical protein ACIA78_28685 [Streptomyces xanthochromogenes]|uniref:hypothetical protein n=1 Tax=Streptomyces xanthochromogenes TaxID=67384 RepID=UPI0037956917
MENITYDVWGTNGSIKFNGRELCITDMDDNVEAELVVSDITSVEWKSAGILDGHIQINTTHSTHKKKFNRTQEANTWADFRASLETARNAR